MNPVRRLRVWVLRLGAALLGLLVTLVLLSGLEFAGYMLLSLTNEDLAHRAARRHAWLGTGESPAHMLSFYPLWGWGGGAPQSRSALKSLNLRAEFGFVPHRSDQSTPLDTHSDVRIFVLGGSTVRGYPHPVNQSIPAHMERMLEDSHEKDFTVVNVGFGGWTSVNELNVLTQKILPFFEPDAVVVMDGVNDAGLAVQAGAQPPRERSSGSGTERETPPAHPRLKQYDRHVKSMNHRPEFVLNQLLKTLGVARYLDAHRYYAGTLLGYWRGSQKPSYRHEMKRYWRRYRLPSDLRERLRERFRKNARIRRILRRMSLPTWQKNRIRRVMAGWSEERWKENGRMLRRASPQKIQRLLGLFPHTLPYDRIDSLPCRSAPLSVQPYVDRVRMARRMAQSHSVELLYALQPSLVHKQPKTPWEEQVVAANVTKSLFGDGQYFTVYRGLCIHSVYRRFFRRAREGFRNLREPRSSSARLVDLSREFDGDPERRYSDFVHYTQDSHRLLARELVDHLKSMQVW